MAPQVARSSGSRHRAESYSERELTVILDFLRRSAEMLHAETLKLTGGKQE
jgi:hypothetical protein